MKTNPITVTDFEITSSPALDPIRVILQDCGLECFGQAWGNFWGAIGISRGIRGFFVEAEPSYLLNALKTRRLNKQESAYLTRIITDVQTALRS